MIDWIVYILFGGTANSGHDDGNTEMGAGGRIRPLTPRQQWHR